jgi:hypothetical protein
MIEISHTLPDLLKKCYGASESFSVNDQLGFNLDIKNSIQKYSAVSYFDEVNWS